MQKLFLYLLPIMILVFPSYVHADGPYLNIPPTNAFDKIHTDNGTITAMNFSMPLNIKSGSGISIKSSNSTHTVIISNSALSTIQGTYNTTQANNLNINSGGFKINFINGSGATVHIQNSGAGKQVNVTISSTGSGGTITSINSQVGPAVNIVGESGNITVTNSTNQIKIGIGTNVDVLNKNQIFTAYKNFTQGFTVTGGQKIFMDSGSDLTYLVGTTLSKRISVFNNGSETARFDPNSVTISDPIRITQTGQTINRITNVPEIGFNIATGGELDIIGDSGFTNVLNIYSKGVNSGGIFKSYLQSSFGNQTMVTAINKTSDASALPPNHMCTPYFVTGNSTFRIICNFNGVAHVLAKG